MVQTRVKPGAPAQEGFLTGQLLIAMPAMGDPFSQSVIYVCAHTPEGAMGLVLNRPIVKPSFEELLKQLDVAPVPPAHRDIGALVRVQAACAAHPIVCRRTGGQCARLRAAHVGLGG